MDSVTKEEIMPDVFLTCVTTGKFKTGCLSVNLLTQLDGAAASKNALLPDVLLRGTAAHPDMNSLSNAMDELYGARIFPIVRKKGELQCFGFLASFADDDFLPAGEQILEKTALLMGELLLEPHTRGGLFPTDAVEGERENLIHKIQAQVNDKRSYAVDRLVRHMCSGERYSVNRLGSEAAAKRITALSLSRHYQKIISTAPVEIFYCGAADRERVKRAMLDAFSALPRTGAGPAIGTCVVRAPKSREIRHFTEEMNVTQGNLAIGFRMGGAADAENLASMMVFNALYGGSVTSKLFLNVRERLSLCYYASSMLEKHKGLMIVSSGIRFDKYQEALDEILRQLELVKAGEFTEQELESAKNYVVSNLKMYQDEAVSLENFYLDAAVEGMRGTPGDVAAMVLLVTRDEVKRVAGKVGTDAVYFLKGRDGNDAV